MKRKTLVAITALGGLVLAGCAGTGDSGAGDDLAWSMWIGSSEDQRAWEAVASEASEAVGRKITIQGAPFADYWTKISTQLGTSSAPCIVTMQSLRVNQFTEGLLPLDDLIAESDLDLDAFDEGALAALSVGGGQYAIPYDTGPLVLFYNKDAFAAAGIAQPEPGWSTADFEAAAGQLSRDDQTAFATAAEDLSLQSLLLAYNGTRLISEGGALSLDDPAFAEGVEWVAGLVAEGYATRADGADSSADNNAFINGTAAMIVEGPWALIDVAAKAGFDVGVTTLPAGPGAGDTYSAGSGFGISTECDDPETAFQAVVTMTSDDVLRGLAEQSRAFPSRTAVQVAWYESAGIDGVEGGIDAALETAIPLPGSAQGDQFSQLLAQYGPQMLNGDRPAAEVIAEMSAQLGD